MSALEKQVRGKHYKDFPYQPVEFYHEANIPANLAFAIKYVVRDKSNKEEDLNKAIHMIELHVQCNKRKLKNKKLRKKKIHKFLNDNKLDEHIRFVIINICCLMSCKKKKHLIEVSEIAIDSINKLLTK